MVHRLSECRSDKHVFDNPRDSDSKFNQVTLECRRGRQQCAAQESTCPCNPRLTELCHPFPWTRMLSKILKTRMSQTARQLGSGRSCLYVKAGCPARHSMSALLDACMSWKSRIHLVSSPGQKSCKASSWVMHCGWSSRLVQRCPKQITNIEGSYLLRIVHWSHRELRIRTDPVCNTLYGFMYFSINSY